MLTRAQGRLLRVLVIDDRLQDRLLRKSGDFSMHLEIIPIRSWGDAQVLISEDGALGGADILLVDISLEKDPLIAKAASITPHSNLLPVGPLLALPFIGRRAVMACITYSAHLANKHLQSHPFFLLAMGLIAARTEGLGGRTPFRSKWLDYDSSIGTLDKIVGEMNTKNPSQVAAALELGIEDYRDRLENMIEQGQIILADRVVLDERLALLIKKAKTKRRVMLDDSLALTLVGKNWSDRIALRSLFADALNFQETEATIVWLQECRKWLSEWVKSNIERALDIIRLQESAELKDGKIRVPEADKLIEERFGKSLSRADLTELLRLVVLFANAYAAFIARSPSKQTVYEKLGDKDKIDQNRYLQWFGERTGSSRFRGSFNRLRPLAAGKDKFERCFLRPGSVIDAADRDAILAYLHAKDSAEGVFLPYVIKPASR
jgi:hypothetical protein